MRPATLLILALTVVTGCTSASPSPPRSLTATRSAPVAGATSSASSPPATPRPTPLPATVAASPSPSDGLAYLAIGDSITFGIGVPDPQRNGFVARVAAGLSTASPPITETRVFAVPGETASGFRERRLDDVMRAIDELGPRIGLVTIGLGANELLRTRREPACADRASEPCLAIVSAAVTTAADALGAIIADVRAALDAAGASARVLVLAYYNPEVGEPMAASVAGSDGIVRCHPAEPAPGLDDRIACLAEKNGVELVDLYAAFLGRESELTRIGQGDVHPNDVGYDVIARAVLATLDAEGR